MAAADIVVSALGLAEIEPNRGVFSNIGITLPELNVKVEEADVRMIPHALHSVNEGASGVILLSNDTDIVVLGLHYCSLLKGHDLKELWIRAGAGNSTRHIPLHTLAETMDSEICKVILSLHESLVVIHPANLPQKLLVWKQTLLNICTNLERISANIDFAGVEPCKLFQIRNIL